MNFNMKYLVQHFYYQLSHFKMHNLTPLLLYIISFIFLSIGVMTLGTDDLIRYLYIVVGLNTVVWFYSMVVLNRNSAFYKDSVVKVNYLPIFYRILPTILFQTFVFVLMLSLSVAIASLSIGFWVMSVFALVYYVVLGGVLIIPFTLLYLIFGSPSDKVNIAVFTVLIISVPIIYLPENLPALLDDILSLNPFYYVVNGLQTNAINLAWNVNRLPHDVLFFTQIAVIYLWIFKFYEKMKFSIYNFEKKRQDV